MGEAHLDHPGDWHWFSGYGPLPIKGPCPHVDCPHNATGTIAYGPDFEHYELIECNVDDGCNGQCRGWTREYPAGRAYAENVPRVLWPDQHLGWLQVVSIPTCPSCRKDKTKPCPVCAAHGSSGDCIWCGSVGFVCPDGPHFTGIMNSAILAGH